MEAAESTTEPVSPPANGQPPEDDWKRTDKGREYVVRGGGKPGIIYRQGSETIAQARERDAKPKEERRPRRQDKASKPKLQPAPKKVDLRELEKALAEGLSAPGVVCAQFGDQWGASHFFNTGPNLARNLVLASEHNPGLRRWLERAASGEDAMMKIIGLMGIGGAIVLYMGPPIVYFLNLPVPDKAREMMKIPDRREPDNAPGPPPSYSPGEASPGAVSS